MKQLLLLGGGHAHVHVLREMARERWTSAEVTLVSPFQRQMYSGMVPGVVAGHYTPQQAVIALQPLTQAAGAYFIQNEAVSLNCARREVQLANGRVLPYDVLSIDTGSVMRRERLPGAAAHATFVRPIETFLSDIEALLEVAAQRGLDLVVVGGGAAAVELALALQHRFTQLAAPSGEGSRVALVIGGDELLRGYPGALVREAEAALNRARITLFRERCTEIRAEAVVLASGARVAADRALLVTGPEAPPWLAGSGLALDGEGFIVTGPALQSGSHPEVFAVGDVATRIDAPHPRSGVYAVRAGPPLWASLKARCATHPAPETAPAHAGTQAITLPRYMPQKHTLNILSLGARRAVATRGGWVAAGRWVWWWKNRIDRAFVTRYTVTGGPEGQARVAEPEAHGRPAPGASGKGQGA